MHRDVEDGNLAEELGAEELGIDQLKDGAD